MRVLFFGDIVGKPGREAIKFILPKWKEKHAPDVIIANVENIAHGDGVTLRTLQEMSEAGIEIFTSGNHIFNRHDKALDELLENEALRLLRPENMGRNLAGRGWLKYPVGGEILVVCNLIGQVQFKPHGYDNPFRTIAELLPVFEKEAAGSPAVIDFHAEATSEKQALAWFLAGRVAAVIGTHTHVPTSDAKILPGGTAYISDVGMVGPRDSVLGLDPSTIIPRFWQEGRPKLELASGPVEVNAVLIETSGPHSTSIRHLQEIVS